MVDRARATVMFPPAVREPDGSLRTYGATPPKGAPLRVPRYRVGGGRSGNVAAGTLSVLRSTVPFVRGAENRAAAHDGTDGETVEEAKVRGPLALRTRDRAVTLEDYEQLAKRAAPGVARTHAIAATGTSLGVRLLVVPTAAVEADGRIEFADLIPGDELLGAIADELEPRRLAGTRLMIERPDYQGVTVVAKLVAHPRVAVDRLRADALAALYRYFDPIRGGSSGDGWPFGGPCSPARCTRCCSRCPAPNSSTRCCCSRPTRRPASAASPRSGSRSTRNALVFSFEHRVRVTAGV